MASKTNSIQIGVSRPELPLDDLPTPEEVFKVKKLGRKEVFRLVLGPSMIALGASLGSGEWLLGPLAFGSYGFMGIGWLITVAAVLQTLFNMEVARFTLATGEVPAVAFSRTPPGKVFWIPFTLFMVYMGWIWGGWASTAGQSIFTLFTGRPNTPEELQIVRFIAIGLMLLSLGLYLFGKKVSQTMETFNTWAVWFVLAFVILVTIFIVPFSYWGKSLATAVIPAPVPKGMDVSLLGGIIGYTGFGAGFNFMLINYYRDKGYGMGSRVGFISGLVGGQKQEVLASGVAIRETPENEKLWKRWWGYLREDQWGIFFVGAMLGMFIPSIMVSWLAGQPGAGVPDRANMPIYAATELGRLYGNWIFILTLLVGSFTLFKTQATVLEMLIRNTADSAYSMFPKLHEWTQGDARKIYYVIAVVMIIAISLIIHLALPTTLVIISSNMANLAGIIFPLVMIYLNTRLPKISRTNWWNILAMIVFALFSAFFFANFVSVQVFGTPLVQF